MFRKLQILIPTKNCIRQEFRFQFFSSFKEVKHVFIGLETLVENELLECFQNFNFYQLGHGFPGSK